MDENSTLNITQALTYELQKQRQLSQTALNQISPYMEVFEDTGWTVKDVISHITMWEMEKTRAVEAFLVGQKYRIPRFNPKKVDSFNKKHYDKHKNDPVKEVMDEWSAVRERLIEAVRAIPVSRMGEDVVPPWGGEPISLTDLIRDAVRYEQEYIDRILYAAANQD